MNTNYQQCHSVNKLEFTPNAAGSSIVVDADSQDPRALTAHKHRMQVSDQMAVDNTDARSEQLQSLTISHDDNNAKASSTIGTNGNRRGNQRYRVRRQDVKFMKRGEQGRADRKMQDARSELPLAVNEAKW